MAKPVTGDFGKWHSRERLTGMRDWGFECVSLRYSNWFSSPLQSCVNTDRKWWWARPTVWGQSTWSPFLLCLAHLEYICWWWKCSIFHNLRSIGQSVKLGVRWGPGGIHLYCTGNWKCPCFFCLFLVWGNSLILKFFMELSNPPTQGLNFYPPPLPYYIQYNILAGTVHPTLRLCKDTQIVND